jgi:hypothetical protein
MKHYEITIYLRDTEERSGSLKIFEQTIDFDYMRQFNPAMMQKIVAVINNLQVPTGLDPLGE